MSIEEQVIAVVRDVLDLSESAGFTPKTDLTSLGADSLDIAEHLIEVKVMPFEVEGGAVYPFAAEKPTTL